MTAHVWWITILMLVALAQTYPCHFTEVMGIAGFYIVMDEIGGFTKIIFYMALTSLSLRRVSREMYPRFEPAATPYIV
jgi:hypothetical protein